MRFCSLFYTKELVQHEGSEFTPELPLLNLTVDRLTGLANINTHCFHRSVLTLASSIVIQWGIIDQQDSG